MSRLVGLPESSARTFAGLLSDHGVHADASRVSRWETGLATASFEVVAAYERVLDLDPGGLRATAAFQRRLGSRRALPPHGLLAARPEPGALERLLDTVVDGDPDGQAWLELGVGVASTVDHFVLPRSLWSSMTDRLVNQTGVSIGSAYLSRVEGAILLASHPSAQRALLRSISDIVGEADVPVVIDAMGLLPELTGPLANDMVLRLLDHDTDAIRAAAIWAASAKVSRGHFAESELTRLQDRVVDLARTRGLDRTGSFSGLVDLVAVLPEPVRAAVTAAVPGAAPRNGARNGAGNGPAAESADVAGSDATDVAGVAFEVLDGVGRSDPMLVRLVGLALDDRRAEHRFLATFTLHQSPYRPVLARVAAELVEAHVTGQPTLSPELAHRLMVILSIVAGAEEADLLLRLAEDPSSELQGMGLLALGHLPPDARPRRPELAPLMLGADDETAFTATYCAGMTADPVLRRVVDQPELAESRRRCVQWWINHGGAIHEGR